MCTIYIIKLLKEVFEKLKESSSYTIFDFREYSLYIYDGLVAKFRKSVKFSREQIAMCTLET